MAERTKRRRKKRKSGIFGKIVSLILIMAAVFAGITVFFEVSVIEVQGVSRYDAGEVIGASGIEIGDRLLFVSGSNVAGNIQSRLPYVERVSVDKRFPNAIEITVVETGEAAYISSEGDYWVVSSSCKILVKVTDEELGGLIKITGITPVSPEEGKEADFTESRKAAYLEELLSLLVERDMSKDVTEIDLSNQSNVTLEYLSRFTVKLGGQEELGYKLQLLESVVREELEENYGGDIDLSDGEKAIFSAE